MNAFSVDDAAHSVLAEGGEITLERITDFIRGKLAGPTIV